MTDSKDGLSVEYIDNICLFDPAHKVKLTVSENRFGQSQRLELRRRLPPELHTQIKAFAEDVLAEETE